MASINLTGTIVDGSSQAWAQAIVTASLQGFANPQGLPRDLATNNPVELVYQTVTADDGSFTLAVESNATIGIPNTGYLIAIQPNASVPPTVVCVQNRFTANTDISTLINGVIKHPTFDCLPFQRAYSTSDVLGPFQGALCVQTGAGVTAGYTLWTYDGAAWVELGGGGGGSGITGLNGDVLAGVSPFTASTAVMVHAFDDSGATPNSLFYIDTQVPPFTGATTPSVGLYAVNTFGNTGTFGKMALYYDNDNNEVWVLQFVDESNTNSYIYGNSDALYIINDFSGDDGESQFFFGNEYSGEGQRLGIYILDQNPNSIIWLRSEGSDPTPTLVFGKGTETIQIEGQDVFIASGISFDSTPILPPGNTQIDGGVVAGAIRSQAWAGFQWYANTQATTIDPISGLNLATLEYNVPGGSTGNPNVWRWGFDTNMEIWCGPGGSSKRVGLFGLDGSGNPFVNFANAGNTLGSGVTAASASSVNLTQGSLLYLTGTTTVETIQYAGTTPTDGQMIYVIPTGAVPFGNTGNIKTTGFTSVAFQLYPMMYSVAQGGWIIAH